MANPTERDEMTEGSTLTVGLVQLDSTADLDKNLQRTQAQIDDAAARGAKLVCLQELFRSPYPCQREDHTQFDLAEPIPGPTTDALTGQARRLGVVLVAPLFERRAAGVYHNSAVVIDTDGSIVGLYRKMHIPDDPLYYEKFYFTPGDLGFPVFSTQVGKVGVGICWDQWFPECARLLALAGAQVICYPTAIGWLPEEKATFGDSQVDAWETMMRSHAIANGAFVVAANRVGVEGELEFWGSSFVSDPTGQLLVKASRDATATLVADCNLAQVDVVRTHWPFLRDRRVDAYRDLERRWID